MIDYDKYTIQALRLLLENNTGATTKEDFENLYRAAHYEEIEQDVALLLVKIRNFIGPIDWSFLDSPIGQVIGRIKYKNDLLLLTEVAEILDFSHQYVVRLLPELKTKRTGKIWQIREDDLNDWLIKKGKPELKEIMKERSKKPMYYAEEKEKFIDPGYEGEEIYDAKK